jgi:hypothetical protein
MRLYTVVLLAAPLLSLAQAPAPPAEVDQALRAQATAFLKYQMEGNFRKAYELVAEDSQDYYLGAAKEKSASVELQKIEYSDNFSKAAVTSASKRTLMMEGRPIEIPSGRIDRWKLENGQWKWYHDASKDVVMTVVGPTPVTTPGPGPSAAQAPKLPKEITPETAAEAIKRVPAPASKVPTLSRQTMPFTVGRESTEEIVFHNNSPGEIRVDADLIADFPGFVVQPKKFQLKAQEETTFKVTYHPSDKGVFSAVLRLTIQPFEREVRVPLILSKESAAAKP